MPLVRDRCICLRKVEFSETSQILTLFSREHGLLSVAAKGAHRRTKAGASKFGGGIDLCDVGDAVFTHDPGKELGILTEWTLREGHLQLRSCLRGLYLAMYAAELVTLLIEDHDPHRELFDRLESTLLELGTARAEESFLSFQLDVLRETGYLPELRGCVICEAASGGDNGDRMFFSSQHGGLVCRSCEAAIPDRLEMDLRLIRLVQGILKLPRQNGVPLRLPQLTRRQTDPLNLLLADHVQHTLSRRLRLAEYVLH